MSGTITIESGTRVDSDTADDSRLNEAISNNSSSTAQLVPSTGILGGYLSNTSGRYPDSDEFVFEYVVDGQDTFRADLAAGSTIAVQVFRDSDFPAPTITLSVAQGGALVDSASGTGSTPLMVSAPDEGPAEISVGTASGGPFRYVLSVSTAGVNNFQGSHYSQPEFVPDEAIVLMSSEGQGNVNSQGLARALSVSSAKSLGQGAWLVRRNPVGAVASQSFGSVGGLRDETLRWIAELKAEPGVEVAEPNYVYRAQTDRDLSSLQWNLPLISLPLAWQAAPARGSSIGVAVMDTGLFTSTPQTYGNWHLDLDANVVPFSSDRILDYVSADLDIDPQFNDRLGYDNNPADPGDGKPQSSNFHGTHVAGIVAALANGEGVNGVAPEISLWPVRVLGRDGAGTLDDLVAAMNWAADNPDIDVINLSLGGVGPSTVLEAAINRADGNGKLVVAAAGNQGTDELTYPAAFERVIGVGAVDAGKVRASYSNFGGSVDLVAPGGDATRDANLDGNADLVISTWGVDDGGEFIRSYAGLQGTSMAAPHVAGVYALMKGANAEAVTPGQFRAWLASGRLTESVGSSTEYGAGLINALRSVDAALDGSVNTIVLSSPSAIEFDLARFSSDLGFTVYPEGESVVVDGVAFNTDLITLEPAPTVGDALPDSVAVSVVEANIVEGQSYATTIEIDYSAGADSGTIEVPVSIDLRALTDERDAGRHYVLLVSPDVSRETIEQRVVTARDGSYSFSFDDIEPGEYFLVAGTDTDNNGFICESGEACAEYPVNGLPEKIVIGEERVTGVTLSTSFRRPTIASMGLPRLGFEGYRLKNLGNTAAEPVRTLETNR
ncbi:S8 family serine peptidase [Marinobacter sp. BW6]|uniref:S8 family serine peptidase n=1 Tax=Marinobacter sp. BW6 TaxID=2592624 RepID=UPI0013968AF7|nr:S8 family serine peptidase [Marinobacter sp. BW6]